ncbi:MAG: NAD-dependent epimerase/dehydratase family protein, partial [Planctomycetota bacterium]
MKILILGGTRFLGRHLATETIGRGHALTLFDKDSDGAAADWIEDRVDSLAELAEHRWDACIDVSTRGSEGATQIAATLEGQVEHYLYVSSVDVHLAEAVTAPRPADGEGEELRGHGARKREVEEALRTALGKRLTILRPGLIVGPHDQSGRFAYWVERALEGSEFLAPAPFDAAIQLVDVRDVSRFALDLIENHVTGEFDVVGPDRSLVFGEVVKGLIHAADPLSSATWVDNGFLLERGLRPWTDIPLWLTEEGPRSVVAIDNAAAQSAGFDPRPLEDTLRDTVDWFAEHDESARASRYLDRERERDLLAEWHRAESLARQQLA